MKPSDFAKIKPMDSVLRKSEAETVAQNIMVILKRTGDEFRELTFDEYTYERLKDGGYSDAEVSYFDKVIKFCKSADAARCFSKAWDF